MSHVNQPAREENIQAIVSFFEMGTKAHAGGLGIELEHTIVDDDLSPVSYEGNRGVGWLLQRLSECHPRYYVPSEFSDSNTLLGLQAPDEAITLEPAAQVELSTGPFNDIASAKQHLEEFEEDLADILVPEGMKAITIGYHPSAKAESLSLIPKYRYEMMADYLGGLSSWGTEMMRGSASTQISIDYTSTEDCLRKLRLANIISPLISLMCDNTPIFEGKPRKRRMVRAQIWQGCDPDRCKNIPGITNRSYTLEDYARYVLDVPAIVPLGDKTARKPETRTFGELYAQRPMEHDDVEHALSMIFTDVRLKRYIEIRPADAMPVPYAISYAAFIKGLLTCKGSLDELDEYFLDVSEDDIASARASLIENGYEGVAFGQPAASLIDGLMSLARTGLDVNEADFLEPLASLTAKRDTLAEQYLRNDNAICSQ